jgi:hypothetical protein
MTAHQFPSPLLYGNPSMSRPSDHSELWTLIRAIASGDTRKAIRLLEMSPQLAVRTVQVAATRENAKAYFLDAIEHYVYGGDTAVHVAAAAYGTGIAKELITRGANPRARNRLGAEPMHYAAVGSPGSKHWDPAAQAAIVEFLISAGADPNSGDRAGVTPLHRAVRTRCAAAVRALLTHGADPRAKSNSGSMPLHLAVQTTGRGGSGTEGARQQQTEIIRLLVSHGARWTDKDGRGKTAKDRTALA